MSSVNYITWHCYRIKDGKEYETEAEAPTREQAIEQLLLQDPSGGRIEELVTLNEFLEGLK